MQIHKELKSQLLNVMVAVSKIEQELNLHNNYLGLMYLKPDLC